MLNPSRLAILSDQTNAILCPPFEWLWVPGGRVILEDAAARGGTPGGEYWIAGFGIAKYLLTNAQYQCFLEAADGFANPDWWDYSPQAAQWRKDRRSPMPTAFEGQDLPRTRVSWFDSLAFCHWLSARLEHLDQENGKRSSSGAEPEAWTICLPTEQEWQRAATGDTGWLYPWGNELDSSRGNFAGSVGRPTPVGSYPEGASPFSLLDLTGNVWEWCLSAWGTEAVSLEGYTYRLIRGGAWNVSHPEYLRAADRGGTGPRGRLNDCGFRIVCHSLDRKGDSS